MGGVSPGSPVSAANTNQAFIDANGDDATIGRLDLNNSLTESGSSVVNIQRAHNAVSSYTGMPLNSAKDVLPAWTNNDVGSNSDNLKVRADQLTAKFNLSTGHKHTGAVGDAPPISSVDIANVKLRGYFLAGTNLSGVTGNNTDVTSELTGQTPSGGLTSKGVVVTNPYNKVIIYYLNGDQVEDSLGNEVYAKITYSSPNYTLTYYSVQSGIETAYTFTGSNSLQWFYQQLYNPISDAPVYSELAIVQSSNSTADIIDASETLAGKVLLANAAPAAIASTGSKGVGTRVAKIDHTHEGVHGVFKTGEVTVISGDVELEGGQNVTITRTGNKFSISSLGGIGFQEVPAGPVNGVNTSFGPLSQLPSSTESVIVFVDGLPVDKSKWTLTSYTITFNGGEQPVYGQDVYVFYVSAGVPAIPPTPTGTLRTEFRTVTSGEESVKKIILAYTPASAGDVLVDIIGGTSQEFNVDYTVVANEFRWNGYALDGVLTTGDKVRIHYIT
jgi:hypothetical protein